MMQTFVGVHPRSGELARPGRPPDSDRPVAFVAVDLLSIDGTSLIDVPLLERKRLLDGVLHQGELVRITPFVRPPGGTFIATWLASGLRGLAYKAANSRYLPGDRNDDWASAPMPPPRPR
jgi:ATP-dependent DNA ligase